MSTLTMKLYREFVEAISRIRLRESLSSDYPDFLQEITYINFVRARVIGAVCFVLLGSLTLLDVHYLNSGLWKTSKGYGLLFVSHCLILMVLGTLLILSWKKSLSRPRDAGLFHRRIVEICIFSGVSCIVLITFADVLISSSIAAYLGTIFAVAAIFLLGNTYCLFLFFSNMVFMVILLTLGTGSPEPTVRIQVINVVTFTLVAVFLSRMLFYYHVKDFKNRILIRRQRERLEELSMTDHLTQAVNRRRFQDIVQGEMARSERHGAPLSLVIIDLDHFKSVNDTHGHLAGDAVLVAFSERVRDNIRQADTFARWGGEEFIILSPHTDLEGMGGLAEKIRSVTETHDFPHDIKVTVSCGVAQYCPPEPLDILLQRSDRALYMAKHNGRNRVEISR